MAGRTRASSEERVGKALADPDRISRTEPNTLKSKLARNHIPLRNGQHDQYLLSTRRSIDGDDAGHYNMTQRPTVVGSYIAALLNGGSLQLKREEYFRRPTSSNNGHAASKGQR